MERVKYYESLSDDFLKTKNQSYQLKDNYKWLHTNIAYKIISKVVYFIILLISFVYSKVFLHVKIKNKKILKGSKGYYIYSNHTQPLGDVFNPFLINFPKHPYIIASPANLGIPILGKILPIAGAMPIPNGLKSLKKFMEAISYYSNDNAIVIYPEGHLWPYATMIREFPTSSFHFPVDDLKNVFVATTTYQKSKILKKPRITIFIDGPLKTDTTLTRRENIKKLHDEVYETMQKRSKLSNFAYIIYKKK